MPLNINTGAEFVAAFQTSGNKDLILKKDITLPRTWNTPALTEAVRIDGGRHTITTDRPLFSSVGDGSEFKRISVRFTYQGSRSDIGAFINVQRARAAFYDCAVYGAIHNNAKNVGGFVGRAQNTLFRGCTNRSEIFAKNNAGGICGRANFCRFFLCKNETAVLGTRAGSSAIGGICGNASGTCLLFCQNKMRVEGHDNVGGIAGLTTQCIIQACRNDGIVKTLDEDDQLNVGGIVGHPTDTLALDNRSDGEYVGNTAHSLVAAGGIAGFAVHSVVFGNRNASAIYGYARQGSSSTSGTGGIVGTLVDDANVGASIVSDNLEEASVQGRINVGGIVGTLRALEHAESSEADLIERNRVCTGTNIVGERAVAGILGSIRYTLASDRLLEVELSNNVVGSDLVSAVDDVYRIAGNIYDGNDNDVDAPAVNPDAAATLNASQGVILTMRSNQANPSMRLDGTNSLSSGDDPYVDPYDDPYYDPYDDSENGDNISRVSGESISYSNEPVDKNDPWYGSNKQHGEDVRACGSGYTMNKCLACVLSASSCPQPYSRRSRSASGAAKRTVTRHSGIAYAGKKSAFKVSGSIGSYIKLADMGCGDGPTPIPPIPPLPPAPPSTEIRFLSRIASVPIAGATFEIIGPIDESGSLTRGKNRAAITRTATSGEGGEIILCGLTPGRYTITQISSPVGWQMISPVTLTVSESGGVKVNAGDGDTLRTDADATAFPLYDTLPAQTKTCLKKA